MRLRAAYHVARLITTRDIPPQVVHSWFIGMNPELGDRAAATLLREGELHVVGPEVLRGTRLHCRRVERLPPIRELFSIGFNPWQRALKLQVLELGD